MRFIGEAIGNESCQRLISRRSGFSTRTWTVSIFPFCALGDIALSAIAMLSVGVELASSGELDPPLAVRDDH